MAQRCLRRMCAGSFSSPSNHARELGHRGAAAAAESPTITTSSPPRTPSDISATALRGSTLRPARAHFELERHRLSHGARSAPRAARGSRARGARPRVSLTTGAALGARRRRPPRCWSSISSSASPTATARSTFALAIRKRSPFVTMIGVMRLVAVRASTSRSNSQQQIAGAHAVAFAHAAARSPRRRARRCRCRRASRISAPLGGRSAIACAGRGDRDDLAVAGRVQLVSRGIDGDAVTQHALREHRVGHFLERRAPAGERREQGQSSPRSSFPRARRCR